MPRNAHQLYARLPDDTSIAYPRAPPLFRSSGPVSCLGELSGPGQLGSLDHLPRPSVLGPASFFNVQVAPGLVAAPMLTNFLRLPVRRSVFDNKIGRDTDN